MREGDRRKLNVVEGLILFVMTSLLGGVLWMAKATIELVASVQFLRADVQDMRSSNSGIPDRVTKLEVRGEAQAKRDQDQDEAIRELRQMKGLK